MNRILKYRGKTIYEMNKFELESQFKFNKTRLLYRSIFFVLIAITIMIQSPIISIIPISFAIITGFWIMQNNNIIKEEIKLRR